MDEDDICLVFLQYYLIYLYVLKKNLERKQNRRWWVRPLNINRNRSGYFATTYKRMKELDPEEFFKYTRMSRLLYENLLVLLQEQLTKHSIRTPVEPECRLAITLAYLSQGVSQQFLAWAFHMGKTTIRSIILETCSIIWKVLSKLYVEPPTKSNLKSIAEGFNTNWNMPHCIGAIDGKYIHIKCPPNSGSLFYDHKGNFSIVLMAACDAKYSFTFVDIGAYGSQHDGGILAASSFGKQLLDNSLPIPDDEALPYSAKIFPYYFVGDAAFPLKINLLRPYPGKLIEGKRRIFNYRLSRARRIIENSFGILVTRWRILLTTINAFPQNVENIVLAALALHNYINKNAAPGDQYCPDKYVDWEDDNHLLHPGEWRDTVQRPLGTVRFGSNNATRNAFSLRDQLAEYFLNEGSVPFQYNRL